MESGPAVFAGTVFALFGGALLGWTAVRRGRGEPVADGVSPVASATVAVLTGVAALVAAAWCLTRP
jgi:hypothetical protein